MPVHGRHRPRPRCELSEVIRSERLGLRRFDPSDAAFVVELVNDPSWIRFIGDRNVQDNLRSRTLLEKLGFRFERTVRLDVGGEELRLYAIAA